MIGSKTDLTIDKSGHKKVLYSSILESFAFLSLLLLGCFDVYDTVIRPIE